MIGDVTEELKKRGLDWKEDQMELISWGLCEEVGDPHVEDGGKNYVIKEVASLKAMRALITKEADSMSAMKFRMNKADKSLMDGLEILSEQRELLKEGSTKDSGRWCNRAFFTHVKAGVGTKKWSIRYMDGNAGIWIS